MRRRKECSGACGICGWGYDAEGQGRSGQFLLEGVDEAAWERWQIPKPQVIVIERHGLG